MKKLISRFIREQKRYSKSEIRSIFELNSNEVEDFIKRLKEFGILKTVKNNVKQKNLSNLIDEDIEIVGTEDEYNKYLYVFTYVGIITIGQRIIKCYPKYHLIEDNLVDEMKQVLQVLKKYESKEQIINMYNGDGQNKGFNILSVILFLINDYYEYGIYNNTEEVTQVNGDGEILWDKTINNSFAFVDNNRPYYLELYTKKTVYDEHDFFKRLHETILTDCHKQLKSSELIELFDIPYIEISEEKIDDFGDKDYILYRLQSEINIQFNTRKQILLKTLYSYVAHERNLEDSYGISMYGTNSFNLVWEKVCAEVLDNKLNTPIGKLELPIPLLEGYNPNIKLIDIIEKPSWIGFGANNNNFEKESKDTLTPDLISIYKNEEVTSFVIFDAKYYNIQLEKEKVLMNYPGIGDITKQYLYQLSYKEFINDHKITDVKNCFLMPYQGDKIVEKGICKLKMLNNLGLNDIQIYLLPVNLMFKKYLAGETIVL